MPASIDPIELTKRLIAAPSVTPATGEVFDVLEEALTASGFAVTRMIFGEAPDGPVENLFAMRGVSGRHFAFAGHLDVVPPGEGWASEPFDPVIRGDLIHGRGAVDMKSAIAAFVSAAAERDPSEGQISLLITGDEEGPAIFGTDALLSWMTANGHKPDLCLVGEPTSTAALGDMVKIGRRGSVNMWIEVKGKEGHVAYPHLADNPIPRLTRIMAEIDAIELDQGNDWFQPSNIEITDIHTGNPVTNVIPPVARARLSIRFNDQQSGAELTERVSALAARHGGTVEARISGEAFLTPPGEFSDLVADAIRSVTDRDPALSTTGGTSDARFISRICPVVEFGLPNATMHKRDEAAALQDIRQLSEIYSAILDRVFG